MANENLNTLLKEYDHKRVSAELDLEKRKENLYSLYPRLKQIETELNNFAIETTKSILLNNNSHSLEDLNEKIGILKKEKESILSSNGFETSYLKPFYECNICKDTGFVSATNNKSVLCNCLKQRLLDINYNKSNMFNLKNENFSTFDDSLFSDEVDVAKYRQNISPRKNILNIKNKSIDFVKNFEDPTYKNLLFTGSTGLR